MDDSSYILEILPLFVGIIVAIFLLFVVSLDLGDNGGNE